MLNLSHISAISTYIHLCLYLFLLELRHIQQNDRVIQGRDGNLYFSHVTEADSRDDYTCNTQFPSARIIVLKEPIKLTVVPCKHQDRGCWLSLTNLCLSLKTFSLNRGEWARHWVIFKITQCLKMQSMVQNTDKQWDSVKPKMFVWCIYNVYTHRLTEQMEWKESSCVGMGKIWDIHNEFKIILLVI